MSKINLLEDVAPTSNELGACSELAERQLQLEDDVIKLEEQLKLAKQNLKQVSEIDLPELMNSLNVKEFKLNDGTKVSVNDVVSGSTPSNGAIERAKGELKDNLIVRKNSCYNYLRDNKADSLISNNYVVQFATGEDSKAKEFEKILDSKQYDFANKSEVNHRRLNSWLKEQIVNGKDVPYDIFKIFTGHRAVIKRSN